MLPGLLAALLLLPGWAGAAARDYLEIRSVSGYSRFEISGGDVVEFHTGGVEFDYAGYRVSAQELRYNKHDQKARAAGNVELRLPLPDQPRPSGMLARSDSLVLDGEQNSLTLSGRVRIQLPGSRLSVGLQEVHFAVAEGLERNQPAAGATGLFDLAGQEVSLDLMDVSARGRVVARDPEGRRLSASGVHFDGARQELLVRGPFVLRGDFGQLEAAAVGGGEEPRPLSLADLTVVGRIREAHLGSSGEPQSLMLVGLAGESPALSFYLAGGELIDTTPAGEDQASWSVWRLRALAPSFALPRAEGPPQLGSAGSLLALKEGNELRVELAGDVRIDYGKALLLAQRLVLLISDGGTEALLPGETVIELNLAELVGTEQLPFQSGSWQP